MTSLGVPVSRAELEARHAATVFKRDCPECRRLREELRETRAKLRAAVTSGVAAVGQAGAAEVEAERLAAAALAEEIDQLEQGDTE